MASIYLVWVGILAKLAFGDSSATQATCVYRWACTCGVGGLPLVSPYRGPLPPPTAHYDFARLGPAVLCDLRLRVYKRLLLQHMHERALGMRTEGSRRI